VRRQANLDRRPRPSASAHRPAPPAFSDRQALANLEALFAKVDAEHSNFSCPSRGRCCQFKETDLEPYLWPLEWRLLERRIAAHGGKVPAPREDGGCRLLDGSGKRCGVYTDRPFGCRTYGCELASGMNRALRDRVHALSRELSTLAERFDESTDRGDSAQGPRPLSRWLAEAK
jgi:Fe-S-cluster containining protein